MKTENEPKEKSFHVNELLNKNLIRNVIFFSGGIILFIAGVVVYGIVLNINEDSLDEAIRQKGYSSLDNVWLLVDRQNYNLKLYQDTVLIKTYRASFGKTLSKPKLRADDGATPVGEYKICLIDTSHKYYKFFRLNYPNLSDAAEALRKNLISQKEYDRLRFEYYYADCPVLETKLGTGIGIHGIGRLNYILKNLPFVFNWTDGSIALSNENIDELFSVIKEGTKVVIH